MAEIITLADYRREPPAPDGAQWFACEPEDADWSFDLRVCVNDDGPYGFILDSQDYGSDDDMAADAVAAFWFAHCLHHMSEGFYNLASDLARDLADNDDSADPQP